MSEPAMICFGYGSLVNRLTRPADELAWSARLHGWERVWSHRSARGQCSSLNIQPLRPSSGRAATGIDGVLARVPAAAVAALDAREHGYDRLMLPASCFDVPLELQNDAAVGVAVYVSTATNTEPADYAFPVLQSYVDCVMAGFLDRFGDHGLSHFVASTVGWDWPIDNDRAYPRYPRAVAVSPATLQGFDALLTPRRLSA